MQALQDKIKGLNLTGMADTLQTRAQYAVKHRVSHLDYLDQLLADELGARSERSLQRRLRNSRVNPAKSLDEYDFGFQPDLDQTQVNELGTCRFLEQKANVIFMGKPGVGKTHLANALGLEALRLGRRVWFTHTNELWVKLHEARADGSHHAVLGKICRYELLVIDELGFQKLPDHSLEDFFEIVRRRYENSSTIITTNRSFEDWNEVLGDAVMASAVIDRLLHHSHVIRITGDSYRVKHLAENGATSSEKTKSTKKN